jgi:allantoicase
VYNLSDLQQQQAKKKVQQSKKTMNYLDLPNLASPQLGTKILFATDEWFAAAGSLRIFLFLFSC